MTGISGKMLIKRKAKSTYKKKRVLGIEPAYNTYYDASSYQ
jgi:hypothetical protein